MGVVLAQYRLAYRQSHSNPATLTFKWLAVAVGVSFFAHTLVLVKSLAWPGPWSAAPTLEVVIALVAVAVLCAMTLSALVRQDLFLGVAVAPAWGSPGPVVPDIPSSTATQPRPRARPPITS